MTPAELSLTAHAVAEREQAREMEMWRRFAFLATQVINISGKSVRRPVKPEDLIQLPGDKDRKRLSKEEAKKRRQEMAETLRAHKAKFWTKLRDESVEKITGESDG